jgi:hypothetical protein
MEEASVSAPVAEEPHPLAELMEQQAPEQTEQKPEAEGEKEEGEGEKPESKNYSQDEVDRIVRKAKRNAAYLARKEAEADLYRQMATRPAQQQEAAQQTDEAPKRESFDSYEEYLEARADWRADQKVKAALAEQQQRVQQSTQHATAQQQGQQFQAQVEKARTAIADFDDVVSTADIPISQTMREAILESEVGALLTYHLAKHPAEATRIATLSPTGQAKALGVIEADLQRKAAPQVSKAPTPITPISGGARTTSDPSKMSMDDYAAWRKKTGARWAR